MFDSAEWHEFVGVGKAPSRYGDDDLRVGHDDRQRGHTSLEAAVGFGMLPRDELDGRLREVDRAVYQGDLRQAFRGIDGPELYQRIEDARRLAQPPRGRGTRAFQAARASVLRGLDAVDRPVFAFAEKTAGSLRHNSEPTNSRHVVKRT